MQADLTSKGGCLCNFVAKQLYMDNILCEVQYHEINHFKKAREACHENSFDGFKHSLGARLLVFEDECNVIVDNVVQFSVIS